MYLTINHLKISKGINSVMTGILKLVRYFFIVPDSEYALIAPYEDGLQEL